MGYYDIRCHKNDIGPTVFKNGVFMEYLAEIHDFWDNQDPIIRNKIFSCTEKFLDTFI